MDEGVKAASPDRASTSRISFEAIGRGGVNDRPPSEAGAGGQERSTTRFKETCRRHLSYRPA